MRTATETADPSSLAAGRTSLSRRVQISAGVFWGADYIFHLHWARARQSKSANLGEFPLDGEPSEATITKKVDLAMEAAEQFDLDAVIGLTEAQTELETCLEPAVTKSINYCHIDFVNVVGTLILKGHGVLAAPTSAGSARSLWPRARLVPRRTRARSHEFDPGYRWSLPSGIAAHRDEYKVMDAMALFLLGPVALCPRGRRNVPSRLVASSTDLKCLQPETGGGSALARWWSISKDPAYCRGCTCRHGQ